MISLSSGSIVASPVATLTTTGKRHIDIAVMMAGHAPAPNQRTKIGINATFGTDELARNAVGTLGNDNAVLLANHGAVSVATTLWSAFGRAERVEELAMLAWRAEQIGGAVLLTADELDAARDQMARFPWQRRASA